MDDLFVGLLLMSAAKLWKWRPWQNYTNRHSDKASFLPSPPCRRSWQAQGWEQIVLAFHENSSKNLPGTILTYSTIIPKFNLIDSVSCYSGICHFRRRSHLAVAHRAVISHPANGAINARVIKSPLWDITSPLWHSRLLTGPLYQSPRFKKLYIGWRIFLAS